MLKKIIRNQAIQTERSKEKFISRYKGIWFILYIMDAPLSYSTYGGEENVALGVLGGVAPPSALPLGSARRARIVMAT